MQQSNPVDICARHGLTWENGMKNVVEASKIEVIQQQDRDSRLFPFMLAAAADSGMKCDLGSIFHLIKKGPGTVQNFNYEDTFVSVNENECLENQTMENHTTTRRRSRRLQEINNKMKRQKGTGTVRTETGKRKRN